MKNNFSCIIIDDEPKAIELLKDCLNALYPNISISHTFTSWSSALHVLKDIECDILFLDVSMPGKTGIDLLSLLPALESEIIFITAHSEHALLAFKFAPTGYILKPINDAQLTVAINKALERAQYKKLSKLNSGPSIASKIGIPNNKGTDYINVDEIIYLEAMNSCTKIKTVDNEIISSYTLSRFEITLDKNIFFHAHRSYIINLNYIKRYTNEGSIVMINGLEIPLSKTLRDEFLLKFNKVSKPGNK